MMFVFALIGIGFVVGVLAAALCVAYWLIADAHLD